MNSPLPKPTPPAKTDDTPQTVVFDQTKKDPAPADSGATSPTITTAKPTASAVPEPSLPIAPANLATQPISALPTASTVSTKSTTPTMQGSTQTPPVTPAQTTVLGQPLPQAIRGEATPAGLVKPVATAPGVLPRTSQPTVTIPTSTPPFAPPTQSPTPPSSLPTSLGITKKADESKAPPKIAQVKSPIMRFLPFIIGGIFLLVAAVFVLSRFFGGGSTSVGDQATPRQTGTQTQRTEVPAEKVTIEYWGLWEPSEVMDQVISAFESENPGVEVNYMRQSPIDYRERLQTALQGSSGPDIFRFHASWVPMLRTFLDPIPASVATTADFENNYYPVVTQQLAIGGQYYGLPLMYDGLVLFYNEDILATAGETPPSTWPELRSLAVKLTVPTATGIQRGGLAIGNATNVEHFSDILATLILQNGGDLIEADSVETRDALLFYTNFQLNDKVWNETLPSSTVAFARGDVAMMFAPSWRAHEIKAVNPELKFATAPLPQLSEDEKVTWGTYWAEGISTSSKKKTQAAQFLAYLNRPDVLQKFFSEASKVRGFGEIYPKIDMADELSENEIIGAILEDAVYAKSGYMNSFTHDNGLNDQMIEYYKVAIESVLDGQDVEDVQTALEQGVSQVLKQYSVNTK